MRLLLLSALTCLFGSSMQAQVQKEDGTWWDNNLEFEVLHENLDSNGQLVLCIKNVEVDRCIENLTTGFQVNIYDSGDKELWTSLWTGRSLDFKFKKSFPEAIYIIIKANKNYVVNSMTGTRIYQDEPLELRYTLK